MGQTGVLANIKVDRNPKVIKKVDRLARSKWHFDLLHVFFKTIVTIGKISTGVKKWATIRS